MRAGRTSHVDLPSAVGGLSRRSARPDRDHTEVLAQRLGTVTRTAGDGQLELGGGLQTLISRFDGDPQRGRIPQTEATVIGSDTGPVREVIRDGENGLLVDYFSPKQVADRIDEVLDHPTRMAEIRVKARQTALERYSLAKMLPQHLQLIEQVANRSMPPTVGMEPERELAASFAVRM